MLGRAMANFSVSLSGGVVAGAFSVASTTNPFASRTGPTLSLPGITGSCQIVGAVELDGSPDDRVALEGGVGVAEAQLAVRAREDAEPEIGQRLIVDSEILHEVELGAGERPAFDLRPGADLRYPVPPVQLDPLSLCHSGQGDEERQA